jgi:hypothetical protein
MIIDGRLQAGYALEDRIGLLFTNGNLTEAVSSNEESRGFYVSLINAKITEEEIKTRSLIR